MKVTICYTRADVAEAVDLAIRRLLPRAKRKESPYQSGFYHIVLSTPYTKKKKGATRK